MRIILNVLADGSCAQLYVYADRGEGGWIYREGEPEQFSIKIRHNHQSLSIDPWHRPLKSCDNDTYIPFTSKVRFATFCDSFALSEYNDPIEYKMLSHNCANAAYFALQLAEINLPALGRIKMMSLSPNALFRMPGPTLTPIDLYHTARRHKLNALQSPTARWSKMDFKLKLASSTLGFWARKETFDDKRQCIKTICSEIERSVKKRPHHMELYLQTLLDTIDFLMSEKTDFNCQAYAALGDRYLERNASRRQRFSDAHVNLSGLVTILGMIKKVVNNYEDPWQFVQSQIDSLLLRTDFDWWPFGYSFTFNMGVIGAAVYAILQDMSNPIDKKVQTNLSQAITNLSHACVLEARAADVDEAAIDAEVDDALIDSETLRM